MCRKRGEWPMLLTRGQFGKIYKFKDSLGEGESITKYPQWAPYRKHSRSMTKTRRVALRCVSCQCSGRKVGLVRPVKGDLDQPSVHKPWVEFFLPSPRPDTLRFSIDSLLYNRQNRVRANTHTHTHTVVKCTLYIYGSLVPQKKKKKKPAFILLQIL